MNHNKVNLRIDPNRGARFGHQFYEAGMLSAMATKLNANLLFNKGFVANSSNFGEIFFPGSMDSVRSIAGEVVCINDFLDSSSFHELILNKSLFDGMPQKNIDIIGDFYSCKWLPQYLRSILSEEDIYSGLLHIAAKLKVALIENNLIVKSLRKQIAVHIRRGDVGSQPALADRFVSEDYYIEIIDRLVKICNVKHDDINIYSTPDFDFTNLIKKHPVKLRLSLGEVDTFGEMVSCSALIGAPSGFTYAAHLCSGNAILVHKKDWNKYYSPMSFRDESKFLEFISILNNRN